MTYTTIPARALSDQFLASLANIISDDKHEPAAEIDIVSLEEEAYESGGCSTCAYTDYEVDVYYTLGDGKGKSWKYNGRFEYLLSRLIEA